MEVLTASLNGALVLVMTLVLTWYIRDRFAEQDRKITELRTEFREEIAGLRSALLSIALAVGAQRRPDSA